MLRFLVRAVCCLSVLNCSTNAFADKADRLFSGMEQRKQSLKSIRLTIQGTLHNRVRVVIDDDRMINTIPATGNYAQPLPISIQLTLDMQNGRCRLEHTQPVYSTQQDRHTNQTILTLYDGNDLRSLLRQDDSPDEHLGSQLSIAVGEVPPNSMSMITDLYPVLLAIGAIGTGDAQLQPSSLFTNQPPKDSFQFVRTTRRLNKECEVFRTLPVNGIPSSHEEFCFVPSCDYLLARWTAFSGVKPTRDLVVRSFSRTVNWYPDRWDLSVYLGDTISQVFRYEVTNIEENIFLADSIFHLDPIPGMSVEVWAHPPPGQGYDTERPSRIRYIIDDSGTWRELSRQGFYYIDGSESEHYVDFSPPYRWRWIVLVAIVVGVILILVCLYALRRQQHKQPDSSS